MRRGGFRKTGVPHAHPDAAPLGFPHAHARPKRQSRPDANADRFPYAHPKPVAESHSLRRAMVLPHGVQRRPAAAEEG